MGHHPDEFVFSIVAFFESFFKMFIYEFWKHFSTDFSKLLLP